MRQIMDSKQQLVNNCGNGLVALFYNEKEVKATEHVQTGEDTYEDVEKTKWEYDYAELVEKQPVSDSSILAAVRSHVSEKVKAYDTSDAVNSLILSKGKKSYAYWMAADKRNQLTRSVTTWKEAGNETYRLDLRDYGTSIDADCDKLLDMLAKVENYAVECYNTTSAHLAEISAMTDIEALMNYNVTAGYPEPLTITL